MRRNLVAVIAIFLSTIAIGLSAYTIHAQKSKSEEERAKARSLPKHPERIIEVMRIYDRLWCERPIGHVDTERLAKEIGEPDRTSHVNAYDGTRLDIWIYKCTDGSVEMFIDPNAKEVTMTGQYPH